MGLNIRFERVKRTDQPMKVTRCNFCRSFVEDSQKERNLHKRSHDREYQNAATEGDPDFEPHEVKQPYVGVTLTGNEWD